MDNVRMAVLSVDEKVCAFFDNLAPDAMHYLEACLHTYLQGSAYTLKIETVTNHEDTRYLMEGNKIAFVYKGKDYMCNIISVERTETEITIDCLGLLLELNNEIREAYKSNGAMSLQQYLDYIDPEHTLTLGINEVADKRIANEWEGSQSILGRLYSIANLFNAEMEFVTELNDDYSLKQVTLNVYRAHDGQYQGIGTNRTDQILRFGNTVDTIRKKTDITDLFTAIHVIGKDGAEITGLNKKEYDSNGRLEYYTEGNTILAQLARDRFPSNLLKPNDGYILKEWTYDSESKEVLYGQGLAQLKKYCVPQVTYEITGYYDSNIGDTFTIIDDGYIPMLILEARVTEQEEYFVDPTQNSTTYSNARELQSEIDPSLLAAMQKMIEDKKLYACDIETDNGTTFVNGVGETTLTAQVMDGITDITNKCAIQWYKNDIPVAPTKSITVSADDVQNKAVYRFVASNNSGSAIGRGESTITNINDGGNGIIVSADEPENPEPGQLWQTESGEPIKRWNGENWVLWYLDVTNLSVENLAAIAATIGTVSNPYTTDIESEWSNEALSGKITIGGAGIKNEYTYVSNNWKGMWRLNPRSYYAELRDTGGTLRSGVIVEPDGINFYDYSTATWVGATASTLDKMSKMFAAIEVTADNQVQINSTFRANTVLSGGQYVATARSTNKISFNWTGSSLEAYVDNVKVGNIALG